MKSKPVFIAVLVALSLLSWADVFVFGTARSNAFSYVVNQTVHVLVLLVAGGLGYVVWQSSQLKKVWVLLYVAGLGTLLAGFGIGYLLQKNGVPHADFMSGLAKIRNTLSGPLPLLVFYLLNVLLSRNPAGESGKTE
ncbi:MAG: hypothetical protein EBZ77_13490 [Chitinophagia bacterium]|nr:hypothetical protein [Chitinophagia bacterium]